MDVFGTWWTQHKFKSQSERHLHFESLTKDEQLILKRSFLDDGWCQLFCQNHIDRILDRIKSAYGLDLIDLRIKALKYGRIFVIERKIWEDIKKMILDYEPLFDSGLIFGGIQSKPWGKHDQFVVVNAQRKGMVNG